jgi:tetratricopeptide (TPR) repeat protein
MVATIKKLQDPTKKPSTREIEAIASLHMKTGDLQQAEKILMEAVESNPNYFRAWNRLIEIKRRQGNQAEAYSLLQKMQMQNRGSARRLVAMGEVKLAMKDYLKAESFFRSVLDKDEWCSPALNGLAEVTFSMDHLDETRRLLSKSALAYKFAVKLNADGIRLAQQERFSEALEHYSKAQYVLPQQDKSPQLFYNIALCYSKWGRPTMAREFLELALIKEPNYKKASRTLEGLKSTPDRALQEDLEVA